MPTFLPSHLLTPLLFTFLLSYFSKYLCSSPARHRSRSGEAGGVVSLCSFLFPLSSFLFSIFYFIGSWNLHF